MKKLTVLEKSIYQFAYAQGYQDAMAESGWTCNDCGNRYEADYTDGCPNTHLDHANISLRKASRALGVQTDWKPE